MARRVYSGRNNRQATCRGLVLQSKGAAYNFESRYQDMIFKFIQKALQHTRRQSIGDFEERFLNLMKGENLYRDYDRSKQTDAADIRTLKKFLRDLGIIDDEDVTTTRADDLLRRGSLLDFMQFYVPRVKVVSPQGKKKSSFKKGSKQGSYGSYRVRLYLMILYAAQVAEEMKVPCLTEDIALTSCRFWPLDETDGVINEEKVKALIEEHFQKKKDGNISYEELFSYEIEKAMEDSSCTRMSVKEKNRKFRNTADLITNYFRMLSTLSLVQQATVEPTSWSLSQFSDGKTGAVPQREIKLTDNGRLVLNSLIKLTPVWFLDIWLFFRESGSEKISAVLPQIDSLARNPKVGIPKNDTYDFLNNYLGVKFVLSGDLFVLESGIDFDWVYDMHSTGTLTKAIFE